MFPVIAWKGAISAINRDAFSAIRATILKQTAVLHVIKSSDFAMSAIRMGAPIAKRHITSTKSVNVLAALTTFMNATNAASTNASDASQNTI